LRATAGETAWDRSGMPRSRRGCAAGRFGKGGRLRGLGSYLTPTPKRGLTKVVFLST
jgi:hypothetical protein